MGSFRHCLLQSWWPSKREKRKKMKSLSCVWLCDPMNCSLSDSSVHGIFQARVLEWVAISFSRGSSWLRDQTWVSLIIGRHFTIWATREAYKKERKPTLRVECCVMLRVHAECKGQLCWWTVLRKLSSGKIIQKRWEEPVSSGICGSGKKSYFWWGIFKKVCR